MPFPYDYKGCPLLKPMYILAGLFRCLEDIVTARTEAESRAAGEKFRTLTTGRIHREVMDFDELFWPPAQAAGFTRDKVVQVTGKIRAAYYSIIQAPAPKGLKQWVAADRQEVIRRLDLQGEEHLKVEDRVSFRRANKDVLGAADAALQAAGDELFPVLSAIEKNGAYRGDKISKPDLAIAVMLTAHRRGENLTVVALAKKTGILRQSFYDKPEFKVVRDTGKRLFGMFNSDKGGAINIPRGTKSKDGKVEATDAPDPDDD